MPTVPPMLARILEKPRAEGEQLLESALSAFLDFGIKRTSMGEIARRAGISPATLYRRYESKNDLIQAVGVREAQRFVAEIEDRVAVLTAMDSQRNGGSRTGEGELIEVFVAFITLLARNELLQRLLRTEPDLILPRLTTGAGPILEVGRIYLAGKLRGLRNTTAAKVFDPDLVAEIMARLAQSLALTPEGLIPLGDELAAREFARRTLLPMAGVQPA